MRVLIEYADHPEWNQIVEEDTWNQVITHTGCSASRLTVVEDWPQLPDEARALNQALRKTGRLTTMLASCMIGRLQQDPEWRLRDFMVIHQLSWADVEPYLIKHKIRAPTYGWNLAHDFGG